MSSGCIGSVEMELKAVRDDQDGSIYPLEGPYRYGKGLLGEINGIIDGRVMVGPHSMGLLATMVSKSPGDYLEIGSYFGGTAILAHLVKKAWGLDGKIICVDPFDPAYPWRRDVETGVEASKEVFLSNCEKFRVPVELIQKRSDEVDWGAVKKKYNVQSVLIDGDHTKAGFEADLKVVRKLLPLYIAIDDVAGRYPHIIDALNSPTTFGGKYKLVHMSGVMAILRRFIK